MFLFITRLWNITLSLGITHFSKVKLDLIECHLDRVEKHKHFHSACQQFNWSCQSRAQFYPFGCCWCVWLGLCGGADGWMDTCWRTWQRQTLNHAGSFRNWKAISNSWRFIFPCPLGWLMSKHGCCVSRRRADAFLASLSDQCEGTLITTWANKA